MKYEQKDYVVLAQKVAAWNHGIQPLVFVKSMSVITEFFSSIIPSNDRVADVMGYTVIVQDNNPLVEDHCLMFVSLMGDGTWGKVVGKLSADFCVIDHRIK